MWLELTAASAAWLAHGAWYAGRAKRRAWLDFGARYGARCWAPALPWLGAFLGVLAGACWIEAHGAVLGSCSWLVAMLAAASFNAIAAPLAPRWFIGASTAAGLLLVTALAGWMHGA